MRRFACLCVVAILAAGGARAGETRCWFERGAVVVPAAFGDIAGDFILDLSAPRSQLHATRAQSDGIAAPTATRDLAVAGERVPGLAVEVVDLDPRTRDFVTSIVGVLGADAVRGYVIDIRFAPCRIGLWRRAPGLETSARIKIREIAGVPAVRAVASDGLHTRAGLFAIDTGATPVRIDKARLSRIPVAGRTPAIRLRALSLAGSLFEQTPAEIEAQAPPGLDGAIGTVVWSRFRLRLDLRKGWLELSRRRTQPRRPL